MADQNSTTLNTTTEPNQFYAPEHFFGVKPDAPALEKGVLGIHLHRINCLILSAQDMYEADEKVIGSTLLETAENLLDQVGDLIAHDNRARRKQAEGGAA